MKENRSYYNELVEFNNAIYADRLFYNRIRLGSDEETLIQRNGDPDKREEKDDWNLFILMEMKTVTPYLN